MSDLRDAHAKGFISKLPHYNSIFNAFENPMLTPILKRMIEEVANDMGLAAAGRHREKMWRNFRKLRQTIDEFEPDFIVIRKSCRTLDVYRYGERIRSYPAVFGQGGKERKLYEGDYRTPTGLYEIIGHTLSALEEFRLTCAGQPIELIIGAGESLIQWLLLPRLSGLSAAHPRLAVTFQNLKTDEIIKRVNPAARPRRAVCSSSAGSGAPGPTR